MPTSGSGKDRWQTGVPTLDELLDNGLVGFHERGMLGAVFGASGAGKSILMLHLCCGFAATRKTPGRDPISPIAVFISHERADVIQEKIERHFRYFNAKGNLEIVAGATFTLKKPGLPKVHICSIPLGSDVQQQVAAIDNILSRIREALRDTRNAKTRLPFNQRVLLCLDNADLVWNQDLLSALSGTDGKTSFGDTGSLEGNAETGPMMLHHRLREKCLNEGVNVFLSFEHPHRDGAEQAPVDVAATAQAYAADFVIGLGQRESDTGFRERYLEVLKAKNQFYLRGRHTFSIVSERSRRTASPKDVGAVICPSLAAQEWWYQKSLRDETPMIQKLLRRKPQWFGMGVAGLDDPKRRLASRSSGNADTIGDLMRLRRGSSSVLVSNVDGLATDLALHFAFNAAMTRQNIDNVLYISFEHDETLLKRRAQSYGLNVPGQGNHIYWFPPEHISEARLLRDVKNLVIGNGTPNRPQFQLVVVDSIYRLYSQFPLFSREPHFVEAMLLMFKRYGITSFIVDVVEAGDETNPTHQSSIVGRVENVFVLRHIQLGPRPASVFSIVKMLEGKPVGEHTWEIQEKALPGEKRQLVADHGIGLYKNLVSGKPEPVELVISLYRDEDDSPYDRYLEHWRKALRQTMGGRVKLVLYGAREYSRIEDALFVARQRPLTDCHIVAIDESWLHRLVEHDLLHPLDRYLGVPGDAVPQASGSRARNEAHQAGARGDFAREGYVTVALSAELWRRACAESCRRKEGGPCRRQKTEQQQRVCAKRWRTAGLLGDRMYAVPLRHNCGLLCADLEYLGRDFRGIPDRSLWDRLEAWRLRQCMDGAPKEAITWTDILRLKEHWVQRHCHSVTPVPQEAEVFFTFCMEQIQSSVCFLIELTLSSRKADEKRNGGRWLRDQLECEAVVANGLGKPAEGFAVFMRPLEQLLNLIGTRQHEFLAQGRFMSLSELQRAVFTRQWMSTLGYLRQKRSSTGHSDAPSELWQHLDGWELPYGDNGHPTPVSGTWYIGMLQGSVAAKTGSAIIEQLAGSTAEQDKLRQYIGLPARSRHYPAGMQDPLPYSVRFVKLARIQKAAAATKVSPAEKREYLTTVIDGDYPFHRGQIAHYEVLASVLWRLMIKAAEATWPSRNKDQKDSCPSIDLRAHAGLFIDAQTMYRQLIARSV